ncbi:MAG: DUF2254 domain-containing protein [Rhodoplanes sp.]
MTWLQHQRFRRFRRRSLWLVPVACMVAALAVAPSIRWIDAHTHWTLLDFGPDGARNVLGALSSSLLTFIVFAFSTLTVAVQIASGQLTPRIIARVFEDRLTKLTLGAFVFSWVYSLAALGRIEAHAPQLAVAFAVVTSLLSVLLFLGLVQRTSRGLRPVAAMTDIANDTCAVIDEVYPRRLTPDDTDRALPPLQAEQAAATILHQGRSSVVLAVDLGGLTALAEQAGCTIEVVPMVGDFVAAGDALFRIRDGMIPARQEARLRDCIDLGSERNLTQDPAFGLRIIVEIAAKALSPAINDPTTAVLAIDQLHHLLHELAYRRLDAAVVRDRSGRPRVVCPTPDWEDFVAMAVTEIRLYGASSPQVTRRLQAMLETLIPLVPPQRRPALSDQIAQLHQTIERTYADPADRVQANRADTQGYGHPRSAGDAVRG